MKYRPQRSSFKQAMQEVVEVANRVELAMVIGRQMSTPVKAEQLSFATIGLDTRNGWDTYRVCVDGCAVGFADAAF